MKYVIATATAFLAVAVQGNLLFLVSTEPNNKGIQYSWVTDRWVCKCSEALLIEEPSDVM